VIAYSLFVVFIIVWYLTRDNIDRDLRFQGTDQEKLEILSSVLRRTDLLLRSLKAKFDPGWEPRYLAYPQLMSLPALLIEISLFVNKTKKRNT
jgi:hypothetical protein